MDSLLPDDADVREQRAGRTVLAILTIDDDVQLFRGNRSNFVDLIRTGQSMGFIVYVLTVKNLLLTRSSLKDMSSMKLRTAGSRDCCPFPT